MMKHTPAGLRDVRLAARSVLRQPRAFGLMLLIVTLCTGATLALLSLLDSVLLRPLGFPQPERLVRVWESQEGDAHVGVAKGNLADWHLANESFTALSGLGVYSLLMVMIALERRQIGIRCALGAEPRALARWIVGRGVRACWVGVVGGWLLSALVLRFASQALGGAFSGALSGVLSGLDPLAMENFGLSAAVAASLVLAAGTAASLPPARQGAAMDPLETLRRA